MPRNPVLSDADKTKVRECLALLQEAQGLVDRAGQALCSVPGFADEWIALSEPYEVIKKHWHNVEARRRGLMEKPS